MKSPATALLAMLLATSLAGFADNKGPFFVPISKGDLLPAARAKLLKSGWKPVQTHASAAELPARSNGKTFFDAGYVEVEDCAGTGKNPCIFNYLNAAGVCLTVYTEGEIPKDAPVEAWDFSCYESRPK